MSDIQIIYQVMSANRPKIEEIDHCFNNQLVVEQLKKITDICWCKEYNTRKDMDHNYLELKDIYDNYSGHNFF